jgi:uncharacterized repeat protein (TIGR01451 family)
MRSLLKGFASLLLGIIGLSAALSVQAYTIERLSLFIYDGSNVYEDRRLTSPSSNLPPGLTVSFNETISGNDRTWTWTFHNTNPAALTNLRVTGFLDADHSAPVNTFFNEYGELIALSAPVDHIAADKWEIGEPGYLTGDLLLRASQGNLNNASTLSAANPDDAAMALSLPIGTLEPNQSLTVTATLAAIGTAGLKQIDADDGSQIVFQLYAQKGTTTTPPASSDYHVTLTGTTVATVGNPVTYTITIGNNGTDDGEGITLTNAVPTAINNVTWNCAGINGATCGTTSGSGNTISLTALVPITGTITVTVNGTANTTGTHANTATIAPRGNTIDPVLTNNTSSVNIVISGVTRVLDADLSISKTTGTPTVNVGDAVTYQLTVTNAGPDDVTGAEIEDTVPSAITGVTWTCTASTNANCGTASGSGNTITLTADLQAGETVTIAISGTANATGTHTNTGTVAAPTGVIDPDTTTNSDSVDITVNAVVSTPEADLTISKTTGTPTVTVGNNVTYQLTVTNTGPDDVAGAEIEDTVPSAITGVTWICTASTNANCGTASGSSNTIALTADLQAGETVTIAISGTANATGTHTNTGTVATPTGVIDLDTANNTSSVNIVISGVTRAFDADLSISTTTNTPTVNVGDAVNYQIVATNTGPDDVTGAQITDNVPANIGGINWTCLASSGAACGAVSGSGNAISLTTDLPVGGIVSIAITGTANTVETVTNTAIITPPADVDDLNTANNTSNVNITVSDTSWQNTPLPIPSSSSGMLVLLGILLAGLAGLSVKPMRRTLLPALLLTAFAGSMLVLNEAKAQVPDNRGTEFWIGFPLNHSGTGVNAALTLFIASDQDGIATISIPGLSFLEEVVFIEGLVSSLKLPLNAQRTNHNQIARLGVHVTATAPITLYGLNQIQYTTDAYLALPVPRLGTEHFAMSYSGSFAGSHFLIVGAHDNTQITITPSDNASPRERNVPYQITLQKGETYRLVANGANGDLTGSLVVSDKPVAFFSGHECTQVPAGRQACDTIVEQLPPTSAWGKQFITVPLASRRNGDTFRVLASENDTPIYINNSHTITLQRGQYHEFILKDPSLIESDKPLLLVQYANSGQYDNVTADPFMMLVTPAGQYLSHYVVTTPAQGISNNYINIVIPELAVSTFKLDGQPVNATFRTLPGTRYQTTQIAVEAGQHTLEASVPFGAYIYGFDDWDSYGYPAGTAMRDLSVDFQPLSCLSGVSARAKPGKVQLVWADTGAIGYGISRADQYEGPYVRIGTTQSRYATYLDDVGLQANTNYFYQIDELDENDEIQCTSNRAVGYPPEEWAPGYPINRAPYFTSLPNLNALMRQEHSYQAQAVDPDGDALTYQLLDAPSGVTMTPEGLLNWTPMVSGRFKITLQVADPSDALALQSFELQVRDPNRPPVITSTPVLVADAGLPYSYQVIATDPDGDALTYSVLTSASGLQINNTGAITWAVPGTAAGEYPVKVIVKDPYDALTFQTFLIKVTPNLAPVVTSTPITRGVRNVPYQYQIIASDPEGLSLSYAFANTAPTGMSLDPDSGLIDWLSPYLGQFSIQIVISDGIRITNHNYTLTIDIFPAENKPPQITSNPTTRVSAGATYSYTISASDPDGETVTLSLLNGPSGMQLNDRVLTWTTTTSDIGLHDVQIEARDPRGGWATQTWVLEVVPATANRPPVISSNPPVTGTAGETYVYQVAASDPDGDPRTFALNIAPAGMTISATGRIEWPIPAGTSGLFDVEIEVADNKGAWVRQSYSIGVGETGNRPPRITSTPGTQTKGGLAYTYTIAATDPDGDPITLTLLDGPVGMQLNGSVLTWATTVADIGPHHIQIEARDPRGGWSTQTWTLEVVSATTNRPPTISSTPLMTGTAGATYVYQISATDPDSDPITYALNTAPTGMTISETGRIAWPIPLGTVGTFDVEIEVADNKGAYVRQNYSIGVGETGNRPPTISSNPALTGTAGSTYTYNISASDPDSDPLTYTLNDAPVGMAFNTGTPNRLEWAIPAGTEGNFDVEIEVSDGRGGFVRQTFAIGVGSGNAGNRPPRFTSTPTATGTAGGSYTYQVTATDPDSDPLTYTLITAPVDMTISVVNATTSRIEWAIPANVIGDVDIEIEVADGRGGTARQGYAISVAGSGNRPPRITSSPGTSATVGTLYAYQPAATDPDSDPLTFSLTEQPSGMILSATNRVEWTPTVAQNGYHDVALKVIDGRGGYAIQTWTVYVQLANNRPPRITSQPIYSVKPGVLYQYKVTATDPDNDALTYSLAEAPAGMTISPQGEVNWTNPIAGSYPVTVRVSDPHGAFVTQNYTLQVGENLPPVINSAPITSTVISTLYSYQVVAIDPEGDFLTYQLVTRPAGMTISTTGGLVEWTPTAKGSHTVTIRVSDGQLTHDQTYTLVVKDADSYADLVRGSNWIQSQQKADNSYMTTNDLARPEIATSEGLTAFRVQGLAFNASQDRAYDYKAAFVTTSTERLARKIIAVAQMSALVPSDVATLKSWQNEDGGFGSYQGYASHPLETSWALKALAAAGEATSTQAQNALIWLIGQQQSGGNWRSNVDSDDLVLTAQVIESLRTYSTYFNLQSQLTNGTQWIMNNRASEQWGSTLKNAWALRAVLPSLVTTVSVQTAIDALTIAQLSNGSWNNDVYLTAIALHALALADQM